MSKDQMNQEKPHTENTSAWQRVEQAIREHQEKNQQVRGIFRQPPEKAENETGSPDGHPIVFVTDMITRTSARLVRATTPKGPPAKVVYWFGFECGDRASVTTLIVPEKESNTDSILASAVANEEIFSAIVSASLVFLGQVRLQQDDEEEFEEGEPGRDVRFEGALSIEIPPSDHPGRLDLDQCRIYRQLDGQCRSISRELHGHLRVIPGFKDLRKPREASSRVFSVPVRANSVP